MIDAASLGAVAGRRIAVLGADGFIGAVATQTALDAGASRVSALCRRDPWRLAHLDDARLARTEVAAWWTDAAQPQLASLIDGHDALILLAYEPPASNEAGAQAQHELTVNALGAGRVARTAAAHDVRVVFSSSASVYGHRRSGRWREDHAPQPRRAYGTGKLAAEHLVAQFAPSHVSMRIATVFGPGENGPRAVPSFLRAALLGQVARLDNGGCDVNDYIHVRDVAAALLAGAAIRECGVVNVASGVGRGTREVLDLVRRHVGEPAGVDEVGSAHAARRTVLDVERARAWLGLEADLEMGPLLVEQAEWLAAHLATSARAATALSP